MLIEVWKDFRAILPGLVNLKFLFKMKLVHCYKKEKPSYWVLKEQFAFTEAFWRIDFLQICLKS